jgi:uncharacterized protein YqhQ
MICSFCMDLSMYLFCSSALLALFLIFNFHEGPCAVFYRKFETNFQFSTSFCRDINDMHPLCGFSLVFFLEIENN